MADKPVEELTGEDIRDMTVNEWIAFRRDHQVFVSDDGTITHQGIRLRTPLETYEEYTRRGRTWEEQQLSLDEPGWKQDQILEAYKAARDMYVKTGSKVFYDNMLAHVWLGVCGYDDAREADEPKPEPKKRKPTWGIFSANAALCVIFWGLVFAAGMPLVLVLPSLVVTFVISTAIAW